MKETRDWKDLTPSEMAREDSQFRGCAGAIIRSGETLWRRCSRKPMAATGYCRPCSIRRKLDLPPMLEVFEYRSFHGDGTGKRIAGGLLASPNVCGVCGAEMGSGQEFTRGLKGAVPVAVCIPCSPAMHPAPHGDVADDVRIGPLRYSYDPSKAVDGCVLCMGQREAYEMMKKRDRPKCTHCGGTGKEPL